MFVFCVLLWIDGWLCWICFNCLWFLRVWFLFWLFTEGCWLAGVVAVYLVVMPYSLGVDCFMLWFGFGLVL